MTVIKDKKAGVSTGKIKTPALALPSEQRAIKEKHAECLTELVRLKRKTQEMENSHAQQIATIQEREHAAQENFKAAQARHRAKMARIAANNVNPTCEFAPRTQEMEQSRQRKKMNILVFIIQAILFGGGIVAVGILLLIKRIFHQQDISCGKIYSTRPILGQIWLNPTNFY
jgi:hypothetical protein